jgi:hypothetical protein
MYNTAYCYCVQINVGQKKILEIETLREFIINLFYYFKILLYFKKINLKMNLNFFYSNLKPIYDKYFNVCSMNIVHIT